MDKKAIIREMKLFKARLGKNMPLEKIYLFGSAATNGKMKKHSDIDILIVSNSFKGEKYGRGKGIHKHWTLDRPTDFICFTPDEFDRLKVKTTIVKEEVENGIAI